MDFAYSPRVEELIERLTRFMEESVYPAETVYREQMAASGDPHHHPLVLEDLKRDARELGLWNLFLPDAELGAGLSNLEYAPLAEITGRSPQIAPEALNCSAPDTGNMEILHMFGTPEQKEHLAPASARGRDPLVFLDDRARCGQLGCHQHPDPDRAPMGMTW